MGDLAYRYLLGDSRPEAARLRAQAVLWDPVSHALFNRVGVRPGWRVLEIGPGQGSLHRELRRRVKGPVDFVDQSPVFAAALRKACLRDGLGPGQMWNTKLLDAPLPRDTYDFIFARWVFMYLPNPEAHVRKLVRALKPGGVLAIQDYHRETFAMAPKPPEWSRLMAADMAFFASQGGDASVGSRLPQLYRRAGLSVTDIEITIKTGAPGSPVWSWLTAYFLGVLDRYATFPPFTRRDAAAIRRHWLAAGRQKTSKLIGPALVDVVGRKGARSQRKGERGEG